VKVLTTSLPEVEKQGGKRDVFPVRVTFLKSSEPGPHLRVNEYQPLMCPGNAVYTVGLGPRPYEISFNRYSLTGKQTSIVVVNLPVDPSERGLLHDPESLQERRGKVTFTARYVYFDPKYVDGKQIIYAQIRWMGTFQFDLPKQ
jgi:hypothetical protein